MCSRLKVKLIAEHEALKAAAAKQKGFFEVMCEPTFPGDYILLCNRSELSFDAVIAIILGIRGAKYMLVAMSFLYWNYVQDYCRFYESSDEGKRKHLNRRTKRFFKRWYSLAQRSDVSLYPQNALIAEFVEKHMPGVA